MRRVVELSDVRVESCSPQLLSDLPEVRHTLERSESLAALRATGAAVTALGGAPRACIRISTRAINNTAHTVFTMSHTAHLGSSQDGRERRWLAQMANIRPA